jgi:hypothetical protein
MIYFNLLSKRDCRLLNDTLDINGVSKPIRRIKRVKGHEFFVKFCIRSMILLATVLMYFLVPYVTSVAKDLHNGAADERMVVSVFFVALCAAIYSFMLSVFVRILGCASCWIINKNSLLLLESTDSPDVRDKLEHLESDLSGRQ